MYKTKIYIIIKLYYIFVNISITVNIDIIPARFKNNKLRNVVNYNHFQN